MGKVATYKNDKRRKEFLARFECNYGAAAEYLFGLVLSPSKRRFFNAVCNIDKGLVVDNQLGSVADSTAVQAAILCLLLRPDSKVNVVIREGEGVAEGVFTTMLPQLVRRITRKEPWLIEYLRMSEGNTLMIGGKRSVSGRLSVISYNDDTICKLAGFDSALWVLPRAEMIDSRAIAIMSKDCVIAFYSDRKQIGNFSISQDNEPVELISLTFERSASF